MEQVLIGLERAYKVPFVDESKYSGQINLTLPANLLDISALADSLKKQGFSISKEIRNIKFQRISDRSDVSVGVPN